MGYYKSRLKIVARELRQNMTPTEKIIWFAVRRKKLLGVHFQK